MSSDVHISIEDHIALVEIRRPPNNFFDLSLICDLADAFEALDENDNCRSLVLAAEGKHFCAGANFSKRESPDSGENVRQTAKTQNQRPDSNPLYQAAVRLFACKKPVVGAIQGAAVGGGFGLALVPDFRVVCKESRFTANFTKLGFHPGFGLTYTLPKLIGQQRANLMFYTGRRIDGLTAIDWGLGDILAEQSSVRTTAMDLAREIAENAPLAVMSVRATMRKNLAQNIREQTDHEFVEQFRLQQSKDHKEGLKAVAERRKGNFIGK